MFDEAADSEVLEHLAHVCFGLAPTAPIRPLAAGNINRSAVAVVDDRQFVLQELNSSVFTDPESLMKNVVAIIDRMREANLPSLELVPTVGDTLLADVDGVLWRCYSFVPGHAAPAITEPDEAQSLARAFGRYAEAMDGLPLTEHLRGYHDFDARVAELEARIDEDPVGRVGSAGDCVNAVERAVDQIRLTPGYEAWREVPVRNAHNDAKAPNCVVAESGARTIIDLDTTMPSTIIADIGELVRSCTRALDSPTPDAVMAQIEAVNRGFLAGYRRDLTDAEHACVLLAGPMLTTENAVRFLSDHLGGDTYYGASHPGVNLERAKEQLRIAALQVDAIEHARLS